MVSHETLVAELAVINAMTTDERLNHAARRRAEQVKRWNEYDQKFHQNNNHSITKSSHTKRIKFGDCITLLEAAARNDFDEVKELLKSKVNPNEANDDGLTTLHQACIDNLEDIVELLLDNHADVNAVDSESWTPLHAACTCGHTNIARLLVKRNADLLALNADNNMPYDICEEEDTLEFIELAMAQKGITQEQINNARSAKEQAILKEVTTLCDQGKDISLPGDDGATILHIAAANGYIDLTRYFLLHTSDPNLQDNDGWTPLHAAACWCQLEIVEILGVEFSADPSIKNNLGEIPAEVTEDEEIKTLLSKLKSQNARKKTKLFRKNLGAGSTRVSGIRGQSFKRMSKRDKKIGISAVEAKSEAKFWSGAPETAETDISSTSLDPSVISQNPSQPPTRSSVQSPTENPDVTDHASGVGAKHRDDVIEKTSDQVRNGNGDPGAYSPDVFTEYKARRAHKLDGDVTQSGGDVIASKGNSSDRNYGSERRKKKKSCIIL